MQKDTSRQVNFIPDNINSLSATIVGTGAIGHALACNLARINIGKIQLVDFDVVENSNTVTQGFFEEDIGQLKVFALKKELLKINSDLNVETISDRWRPIQKLSDIIFTCVDKINIRERIYKSLKNFDLFVDGRMFGEIMRVITVLPRDTHYEDTLFSQEEVFTGGCTTQATIYTANIIAGLMTTQLAHHMRGLPLKRDISLNLMSHDLYEN